MEFCKVKNTADYDLPHEAKANTCSCKFKERDHAMECPRFDGEEFPFKAGETLMLEKDIGRHFQKNYPEIKIVDDNLEGVLTLQDSDGEEYTMEKGSKSARPKKKGGKKRGDEDTEEVSIPEEPGGDYLKPEGRASG